MKKIIKKYNQPGEYEVVIPFGKNEEKEWVGVVDVRGGGEYKIHVVAEHKSPGGRGRVVVKVVADKGARISLSGMIKIEKEAQGVDNFLELRVLLLDEKSVAVVDPQLEIEVNEVKAGHAASVGKVDEEQLEYLMSRGMGREQAVEEIVEGWLVI